MSTAMGIRWPAFLRRQDALAAERCALSLLAALACGIARADSWQITPLVSVTETYSDNISLVAASPQQGWISDIAPGIRVDGASARLSAYLDYRRQNLYYQGNSAWNRQQNQLNAFAKLEAIDNWLFVDARSTIAQRNQSVFAPVSADGTSAAANQAETRTVLVAPYIRGQVSNFADYLVRYSAADLRSNDDTLADTRVGQYLGSVKSRATGHIGWFGDVIGTQVKNDLIRDRNDTRFRLGLVFPIGAQLHISAFGGRERTNYASDEEKSTSTSGAGVEWSPDRRTQVALLRERRFFGYGHNLLLAHRTALTAWRYADSKDVAMLPALLGSYAPGSLQELMSDLLEASIPDPLERSRAVRARMDASGSASSFAGAEGVLTSRLYVERVREASVALLGVRNTLTLLLRQRDEELLPFSPAASDGFSDSADIRERSAALAWLYRLAPLTTLTVSLGHRKSEAMDVTGLQEKQNTQTVALSFRLGPKATASLGARRARSDGAVNGLVRENAAVASLTQQF